MRLTFDDYVLDAARRELQRGLEPVAVEPQVFDLLVYLAQNPDRVVSKDELLQAVWDGRIVTDSAITNRINAARRAIGDSGEAQRLIRTVPRKGYRFIGIVIESDAEPPTAAIPPDSPHRRAVAPAFCVAAASALLGAAIAAFLLWPRTGPLWPLTAGPHTEQTPIVTSASNPHLIAGVPAAAIGNRTERPSLPENLTGLATELSWAQALPVASHRTAPAHLDRSTIAPQSASSAPEPSKAMAITRAVSAGPLDPERSLAYAGPYRVEEGKFPEVPCTGTRMAPSPKAKPAFSRGEPFVHCDKAVVDVITCRAKDLLIEASTLISDPHTGTGFATRCYVDGDPGYGQTDFQDMNQVTRRGRSWRNFLSNGEEKSIEFSDGAHNCVAVHQPGPKWQGGYVYMLHASICRTDTAAVRAEDAAYALSLLQLRPDDPASDLRTVGK